MNEVLNEGHLSCWFLSPTLYYLHQFCSLSVLMTRWELLYTKNWECHLITGSSLAAEEQVHFGFGSPSADFIDKSPAGAATWNQTGSLLCKQPLKHLCPFRDYRHSLRTGLVRKLKDFPLDFYPSPAPK